jgi:hypothetical protein
LKCLLRIVKNFDDISLHGPAKEAQDHIVVVYDQDAAREVHEFPFSNHAPIRTEAARASKLVRAIGSSVSGVWII